MSQEFCPHVVEISMTLHGGRGGYVPIAREDRPSSSIVFALIKTSREPIPSIEARWRHVAIY